MNNETYDKIIDDLLFINEISLITQELEDVLSQIDNLADARALKEHLSECLCGFKEDVIEENIMEPIEDVCITTMKGLGRARLAAKFDDAKIG